MKHLRFARPSRSSTAWLPRSFTFGRTAMDGSALGGGQRWHGFGLRGVEGEE